MEESVLEMILPTLVHSICKGNASEALAKSLAKELASRNITVNSIAPGFISSDMTDILTDDQKSEILNQIPIQKFGDPKNIADLAVFLASEKGQYITGQTISVDGGLYMI